MRHASTRWLVIALAALGVSCADNAILEIELDLPASPSATPTYAFVQTRSADTVDFSVAWGGADAPDGFLLGAAPVVQHVSVVASDASMSRPIGVRVRFCADRVCGSLSPDDSRAPEVRYVITRAFYRGHRTRVTLVPSMPSTTPTTTTIAKCEVAGCTSGTTANYCYGDGRHFCE